MITSLIGLEKYILDTYGVKPDYPWAKDPVSAVFRHERNKKWFALIMRIDKRKLGLDSDGQMDIVNLKCDANIVPSMWQQKGVYPAYHMNKEHWITVVLDSDTEEDILKFLVALSYDLTNKK